MPLRRFVVLWVAVAALLVAPIRGGAESDDEFEARLSAELTRRSREAAELFTQANAARARNDHATAARLYGQVAELVSTFAPAVRRQCGEMLEP